MKKLLGLLTLLFCLPSVQAQNIEGQIVASQFGQYQVPGIITGSLQFSPDSCMVSGGGKNFAAFSVGVPVKIVDANPNLNEIDTPSAVFPQQCAISMSTSHIHTIPFYLTSGTGGLQEALTNGPTKAGGPNTVVLNADWYSQAAPGNPATVIASVHGSTALGLVDVTTTPYTWYSWNGSQYIAVSIGGGGTPCTSVSNGVQFNNGGSFGCSAGFTYSSSVLNVPAVSVASTAGGINWAASGTQNVGLSNPSAGVLDLDTTAAGNRAGTLNLGFLNSATTTAAALYLQAANTNIMQQLPAGATANYTIAWPAAAPTGGSLTCPAAVGGIAACTWTAPAFQSLTTTGSSGAATLIGGVLNIPQYSGGGSLPTASAIGQVLTATGSGTTYTAQIPSGGTTWYYPVEWYGAVGDATGATGVGTDNTTAIQACLTAVAAAAGKGQCLLQAKKYRITEPLTISASGVGLAGVSYGAWSTAISNQLSANMPVSALVIDSATADAVDAAGSSISAPISFNKFNDFTIIRTVADTGAGTGCATVGGHAGAAGLSIQYAGGFVVDHVWSEDSACNFYFYNAGAYGTGSVENSGSMWGANGFNPGVPVYGFFYNGSQSAESFRLRNSFSQTVYPGYSGVQSVGLLVSGPQLNDIFVNHFETAFQTYGEYFQLTGSGSTGVSSSDIHLVDCVNDSFYTAGIEINGLTEATGGQVEINGGWDTTGTSSAKGIDILNSTGVTVSNVGFGSNGSQAYGVWASGSSHLAITGNRFLNQGTASISLNTVSDAAVTGNAISAVSGNTQAMIQGISLTRSSITGNTLGGYATTGVSLDSGSSNNNYTGVSAIDPAHITTQVSNAGAGNTFDGMGGLIAKLTGTGTPATITFSSIPQIYQNLRLVGNFFITSGTNLALIFNADSTAAHYAYGLNYQSSGTAGATASNSAANALIGASGGAVTVDIPNYTAGTAGGVNFLGNFSTFTIGSTRLSGSGGGLWTGTDVTSLTLEDTGGSALFTAASTFSLYGFN